MPDKYKDQVEKAKAKNSRLERLIKEHEAEHRESSKNRTETKSGGKSKYHASRAMIDGIVFASHKESRYYLSLKSREKRGEITDLTLQPEFILQEEFYRNGKKYRPIKYIGDFRYVEDGHIVVVDVKGYRTKEYMIKKKLFLYRYPDIEFREV